MIVWGEKKREEAQGFKLTPHCRGQGNEEGWASETIGPEVGWGESPKKKGALEDRRVDAREEGAHRSNRRMGNYPLCLNPLHVSVMTRAV